MVTFEKAEGIALLAETVRVRMGWDYAIIRKVAFLENGAWQRGQLQYSGVITVARKTEPYETRRNRLIHRR